MVELLRSPRRLLLFAFEGVLVAIVLIAAACIRLGLHDGLTYPHIAKKALLVGLVVQGAAYYAGMYELHAVQTARALFSSVLKALALASVILWGLFYAVRPLEIGRGIFLPTIAFTALVVPSWRLLYN